jgi:hypothetical protein
VYHTAHVHLAARTKPLVAALLPIFPSHLMSSQDTLVVHPYLSAQHILFQNADITTPHDVGLRCYCDLLLSEHKRSEIEDEGKADATASGLSFETTSQHVRFIRSSVPLGVSQCQLLEYIPSHFMPSPF